MSSQFTMAVVGMAIATSLAGAGTARADFKVVTPDVNKGEFALETVGNVGSDPNPDKSGEQSYTAEAEYGLTNWWQTELEFEFNRDAGSDAGQRLRFSQITSENTFQFTERGEYWIDTGFFAEYGQGITAGSVNETTFGPLLRKDLWGTSNTLNLFVEKDLGPHASGRPQLLYAWETRVDAWQVKFGRQFTVEPGIQYYGQPGPFGHFNHLGRSRQPRRPAALRQGLRYRPGHARMERRSSLRPQRGRAALHAALANGTRDPFLRRNRFEPNRPEP